MSEHIHVLIPLGAFLLFVVGSIALGNRARRRRAKAFEAWASLYGTKVEWVNETSGRFAVTFEDREIEFMDVRRGGGIGSESSAAQYLMVATRLHGTSWDLHSVDITRRWKTSEVFEESFKIHDLGLPMRDGWLSAAVRRAIGASFAPANRVRKISIDAGQLVFLLSDAPGGIAKQSVDSLVASVAELATQLERARR